MINRKRPVAMITRGQSGSQVKRSATMKRGEIRRKERCKEGKRKKGRVHKE
jgi:hypothetical protein